MTWREEAACLGLDTELFYAPAESGYRYNEYALVVCKHCPVAANCLTEAMGNEAGDNNRRHGIWGGLKPHQRTELGRNRG